MLIVLAKWDEEEGPIVISYYPPKNPITNDPDDLAIQSFMSGQSIFGGEEFGKISVTIPFMAYNAKGKIFFDFIEDRTVRGGRLPFLLGIFVEDTFDESLFDVIEVESAKFIAKQANLETIALEDHFNSLQQLIQLSEGRLARFSVFSENWAILADGVELLWKFGTINDSTAYLLTTLAFQMTKLAVDISSGAISIVYTEKNRKPAKEANIFSLSFGGKYLFLCSNPELTCRLLRVGRITGDKVDLCTTVLQAQAMNLYGALWLTAAKKPEDRLFIERTFHDVLEELGVERSPTTIAKKGLANFRGLDISECLFLHWYVRRQLEQYWHPQSPWAVIFNPYTLEVTKSYGKEQDLETLGQLSSIFMLFTRLFQSPPERIVWGEDELNTVELISWSLTKDESSLDDYTLATNDLTQLAQQTDFWDLLRTLNPKIRHSLYKELKMRLSTKAGSQLSLKLKRSKITRLKQVFLKELKS
ncbi:MAG: hypothetical protein ACFFCQ_08345 [Promethearchaeota archaeon]